MIRFVDLRSAKIAGYRFAFWDTVRDRFVQMLDDQAWETWAEFAADCPTDQLARFHALLPHWAR